MPFGVNRASGEEAELRSSNTKRHRRDLLFRKKHARAPDEEGRNGDEDSGSQVAAIFMRPNQEETDARDEASSRSSAIMNKIFSKTEKRAQIKVVYHHFGESDVLTVEHEETPVPSPTTPHHVLIKVQASTVTLNDCLLRRGFDFNVLSPRSLPITPGCDFVGHIVEVGSKVTGFQSGDRVASLVQSGGNARFISVPAGSLVKVPVQLDSGEVAALVSVYSTAYQALRKVTAGGPMFSLKGKRVLVLGGMEVGVALMQLLKKASATIFTTAPINKHVYLKSLLGVHPLPEDEWNTQESDFDYIFDGFGETDTAAKALKNDGELVCFGHAGMLKERDIGFLGVPIKTHFARMFNFSKRVHYVEIWESFAHDPETFKDNLQTLLQLLKWNKLTPHIAKRVALTQVAAAQSRLERGEIRGTIVCFPWRPVSSGSISKIEEETSPR